MALQLSISLSKIRKVKNCKFTNRMWYNTQRLTYSHN